MSKKTRAGSGPDIAAGRLPAEVYVANFETDAKEPLDRSRALVESSRCYFCHDAPCIEACPTGIDIPSFIRKIQTGNLKGSAKTILEQNIFGGACARVCPTEILCERACVRNIGEDKPVAIGLLQRHATDWLLERGVQPFARAPRTGKRVAVVGGGPAGLACAHRLAMLGHDTTVVEARPKLGGLNEYGIAAYKVPRDFAQSEVAFILSIGGIEPRTGVMLGRDVGLAQLRKEFEAVFLGMGLSGVGALQAEGEGLAGVMDAVAYIAELRQAKDKSRLPVGRRVVVIGGGNTAIDIAVQTRRLGAEDVTIVYRRGPEHMGATWHEQEFAQVNGVRIRHWARPARVIGESGHAAAVEFECTALDPAGRLVGAGDGFTLAADQVFKAIGQTFIADPVVPGAAEPLEIRDGRILVDGARATSLPGVFAGGDCVAGVDLTVTAVEDGKIAAHSIDRYLKTRQAAA